MAIRILLADDHTMFRAGLRMVLEGESDFEVLGEASSGPEALKLVESLKPDALILDLSMPGGMSGARTAEEVLKLDPDLTLVVVTMHEDEYYLKEMLRIGARGYLLKRSGAPELVQAVRAAVRGDIFVDPTLAKTMISTYVGRRRAQPSSNGRLDRLTKREREVCGLLAMGFTNAEVGEKLFISKRTVETHRMHIMRKLGLTTRAELVRFAIDNGLMTVT